MEALDRILGISKSAAQKLKAPAYSQALEDPKLHASPMQIVVFQEEQHTEQADSE